MKIKVVEFADISFTTENLSLPKAKKVLSRNICKTSYCQRIVIYTKYPCGVVDVSISLKSVNKIV